MVISVAGLLLLQAISQGGGGTASQRPSASIGVVQRGFEVRPDTVTVGDPFSVIVRIRAPIGTSVEFPQTPDSGAAVEAIDPVQVVQSTDTAANEQTAVYRVAAWDVGSLRIPFADVLVRDGARTVRVGLNGISVFVVTVLPPDSTQRVPKPARDVFTFGPPWWIWALAALAAALLIWIAHWLWRRRRRAVVPEEDPYTVAVREFDRVEALGLVAAGERTRHAALMVEILRDYLGRVVPAASPALTTSELLSALRGTRLPMSRLAALLGETDLVKFARRPLTAPRAVEIGRDARSVADAVRAVATAPPQEKAA